MNAAGASEWDAFAEEFDFMARTIGDARDTALVDLMPTGSDRALDAGCGTGLLSMDLARRVRYVVGLDMSRSMIAVARKHRAEQERDNVTFTLADLEALPFVEHSFDFVVAASSVQRTNLEVSVPELRRMVKPGGRLALYVNVSSFPRLRDWRPIRIVGSIRAAAGYLSAHGFRTTWRLMRFQTSSAWIHQGDQVEYVRARGGQARDRALVSARPVPTPDALREICTRLLPGCSIERTNKWAVMVTWDSPSADGEDAAGCLTVGGGAAGCRSRVG